MIGTNYTAISRNHLNESPPRSIKSSVEIVKSGEKNLWIFDRTQSKYIFQVGKQYFRPADDSYPGAVNNGEKKTVFACGSRDDDQKETRNIHRLPVGIEPTVITISYWPPRRSSLKGGREKSS